MIYWIEFWVFLCGLFFIVGLLGWIGYLDIIDNEITRGEVWTTTANEQLIASALSDYALQHGGMYPTGKTSTEVFQKLYDGHYLTNGNSVFLVGPGKAENNDQYSVRLGPENVGWDIVIHADGTPLTIRDPGDVPLLFATGILGPITLVDGPNPVTLVAKADRPRGCGINECFRDTTTLTNGFSPLPDCLLATSYRINLTFSNFRTKGQKYITIQP